MKITNIDTLIEEFRNGRDIWSRTSVELAVREIVRQRNYIEKLEKQIPDLNLNLAKANLRITELEQERRWISIEEATRLEHGFYLFEDKRGNHGIGCFPFKDGKVNFFDAVKIYNMKLYPPHMKPSKNE